MFHWCIASIDHNQLAICLGYCPVESSHVVPLLVNSFKRALFCYTGETVRGYKAYDLSIGSSSGS